jgi:hypothetical protein
MFKSGQSAETDIDLVSFNPGTLFYEAVSAADFFVAAFFPGTFAPLFTT